MPMILLSQGLSTEIDEIDLDTVIVYKWYADVQKWTTYARSDQPINRPRLHQFIMKPRAGFITHHIDGNGLNNKRSNLENITQQKHAFLSRLRYNKNSTQYRGVYKHGKKYAACIWINYERTWLGVFETAELASQVYEYNRKELLKKFDDIL